jgi:hypothetical protein
VRMAHFERRTERRQRICRASIFLVVCEAIPGSI